MGSGKGIGRFMTNIFLRELRIVWQKARPEPSPLVHLSAQHLGLLKGGKDLLRSLKAIWSENKILRKNFCDFEAALVRLRHECNRRVFESLQSGQLRKQRKSETPCSGFSIKEGSADQPRIARNPGSPIDGCLLRALGWAKASELQSSFGENSFLFRRRSLSLSVELSARALSTSGPPHLRRGA